MIDSNSKYLSNALPYVFESQIGQRVKYTANTGVGLLSTANSNLDGSGTLVTILTASANGTLIRSITIEAAQSTTRGMVRLFSNTDLIAEYNIPAQIVGSTDKAYRIEVKTDFFISTTLKASTQNGENFVVTAEGDDVTYP